MQKYEIILVSHKFPPGAKAGVANHVYQLAAMLSSQGISCRVIAQSARNKKFHDPTDVVVYRSKIESPLFLKKKGGRFFLPLEKFFFTSFSIFTALIKLRSAKKTIFHGHHSTHGGSQAVTISIILNKLSVVTIHGMELDNIDSPTPPKQFQPLMGASAIICQKEIARDKLEQWGYPSNRIFKIIGPIQTRIIELGEKYCCDSKKTPTILFSGRFQAVKQPWLIIKAISILKYSGYNIRAILLGDGKLLNDMKKLASKLAIEDLIDFEGWVTDIAPFLLKTSIFTALSDQHNSSDLSLLEAMAVGIPAIATNSTGISEIINHGVNGLVCNGSAESLAQTIIYLLEHPNLARKISINGRKTAIEKAAPQSFLSNHLRIYDELTISS